MCRRLGVWASGDVWLRMAGESAAVNKMSREGQSSPARVRALGQVALEQLQHIRLV